MPELSYVHGATTNALGEPTSTTCAGRPPGRRSRALVAGHQAIEPPIESDRAVRRSHAAPGARCHEGNRRIWLRIATSGSSSSTPPPPWARSSSTSTPPTARLELEYALKPFGISFLIHAQPFASGYRPCSPRSRQVPWFREPSSGRRGSAMTRRGESVAGGSPRVEQSLQFDDPINIQYTSGTTASEGATLTHHNISTTAFIAETLKYSEQDRVCIPCPLSLLAWCWATSHAPRNARRCHSG